MNFTMMHGFANININAITFNN